MRTKLLCGAALLGLAAALPVVSANAATDDKLQWFGTVYIKFLDGNRNLNGLTNNVETIPGETNGDQGQGIEADLNLKANVSRNVEAGVRLQSRFNQNFWSNFGGFGYNPDPANLGDENNPLRNQYIKLRGAYVRITPGYEWIDSVLIGNNDFGLWDPLTLGKFRYIDRDNAGGVIAQGTGANGAVKWDVARLSLPKLFLGPGFSNDNSNLFANDAAWITQWKVQASPTTNLTAIVMHVDDRERDPRDTDVRDGRNTISRYSNEVYALKGQFTGIPNLDINAAAYYSEFEIANTACPGTDLNGSCRFSPTLRRDASDWAGFLNFEIGEIIPNLTFSAQAFHIGSDYLSVLAARREADVLLTEGREGSWQWGRPDYNFGNPNNGNSTGGLGYGGWNGSTQQVVSLIADNDNTDFDERAVETVIGWQGVTFVPRFSQGDLELQGEISYVTFDTNWQACGGTDKDRDCARYPRQEGIHSWGLGGDHRSPYAPYQDRHFWIAALNGNYLADIGEGLQLSARIKYIRDEDKRVTQQSLLADAYSDGSGNPGISYCCGNGAFESLPVAQRQVTNVGDDDRKADYWTFGTSAGYQLTADLFGRLVYEYQYVDLVDGTVNIAPSGGQFELNNDFGYAEYLTGEHSKNKVAFQGSYFLSGLEVGADIQYVWGTFEPKFNAPTGRTLAQYTAANGTIITPLGNISRNKVELDQYRLKVFTKVQF
jgi:hypothetical protein